MFGGLKNIKQKISDLKDKLETIELNGQDSSALVKVRCNANRKILAIEINESVLKVRDKQEIENLIIEATNNALSKAEAIFIEETKKIMPNIPGLGNIF